MTEYDKQASDFLASAKVRIIRTFTGTKKYFPEDKEARDTYEIRIERIEDSKKFFSFTFGDSVYNTDMRHMTVYEIKMGDLRKKHPYMSSPTLAEYKENKNGPSDYSLLACISSESYQYDTHQDFCDNFGYTTDSRKGLELYLACQEQATKINRFFTAEELEQLREIQ